MSFSNVSLFNNNPTTKNECHSSSSNTLHTTTPVEAKEKRQQKMARTRSAPLAMTAAQQQTMVNGRKRLPFLEPITSASFKHACVGSDKEDRTNADIRASDDVCLSIQEQELVDAAWAAIHSANYDGVNKATPFIPPVAPKTTTTPNTPVTTDNVNLAVVDLLTKAADALPDLAEDIMSLVEDDLCDAVGQVALFAPPSKRTSTPPGEQHPPLKVISGYEEEEKRVITGADAALSTSTTYFLNRISARLTDLVYRSNRPRLRQFLELFDQPPPWGETLPVVEDVTDYDDDDDNDN
jgi:hypothetical protein